MMLSQQMNLLIKGKNKGIPFLLMFFYGAILFNYTACDFNNKSDKAAADAYLDSLSQSVLNLENALQIDAQKLVQRKALISNQWIPKTKDTAADIAQKFVLDLRGILFAYDTYLNNHLLFSAAVQLYKNEIEEMKTEYAEGVSDKNRFKNEYTQLSNKIKAIQTKVEQSAKPVYDLEPMFLRYQRLFKN
jgi:hypothetical protein